MLIKEYKQFWKKLTELGLKQGESNSERIRVIIINQGLIIAVLIPIILLLQQGISAGKWTTLPLYIQLVINALLWYIHYRGGVVFVRFCINIIYPLIMVWVIYLFGPSLKGEYAFFILLITSVIFHSKRIVQIAFISYNFLMYLLSVYLLSIYDSPMADLIGPSDRIAVFLSISFVIIAVISLYFFEHKKYEERSNQLLKELEQKNTYLFNAYQEIERFAYITSHDLKTPLRTMHSFIGLLKRDIDKGNFKAIPDYVNFIQSGAEKMDALIEDILNYSRIEHIDKDSVEEVNLEMMAREIVEGMILEPNRTISLTTDRLPTLFLPRLYWQLLLQNFIDNGVKYNSHSNIHIHIQHQLTDQFLSVSVKDNGIGIAPEYHDKIFELFRRLHTDARYPGSGIGLAICKKLIEKMDGTIAINSQKGKGSCFTIEVPYSSN
jgi:signal transduction histidine kinase